MGTGKQLYVPFLVFALGLVVGTTSHAATPVGGQLIAKNTPAFVNTAKNLGPANPAEIIDVSIWLNPHNREHSTRWPRSSTSRRPLITTTG